MSLREKQILFTRLLADLIQWGNAHGYICRIRDAYRDPRVFGEVGEKVGYGHPRSCHKIGLAADVLIDIDGVWQTETQAYEPMGEKWESMHDLARWGGRFNDGNHFSITHSGMR